MAKSTRQPIQPLHLRVFLASPGDVADERALARRVISRLPADPFINGRVTLEDVAWDKPGARTAMWATLTPQEAISKGLPKPSECDAVVVIFWSRMGTLMDDSHRKPDGSRYLSGTEWEFEDAFRAAKRNNVPKVLVYRRTQPRTIDVSDSQAFEQIRQAKLVGQF